MERGGRKLPLLSTGVVSGTSGLQKSSEKPLQDSEKALDCKSEVRKTKPQSGRVTALLFDN